MHRLVVASALVVVGCGRLAFDPLDGDARSATLDGAGSMQPGELVAPNADPGDTFGREVALSGDGSTLAVSADGERSNATGIDGDETDNSAFNAGAAYVFVWTGVAWERQAYLKASNTETGDSFGSSIALSRDGNTLAVTCYDDSTTPGIDGDATNNNGSLVGAVFVFVRSGSTWSQQAYIKASNPDSLDFFGIDVALSADGNTLAVGARGEASPGTGINMANPSQNTATNAGAAYVFVRSGTAWAQQAYIKPSNTAANAQFGQTVALDDSGNTLAVGAIADDTLGINTGATYVFTRAGTVWSEERLVWPVVVDGGDTFGIATSLSADGNYLLVGADQESSNAIDVNGEQTNNAVMWSGSAYVFHREGGLWPQRAYLKSSRPGVEDRFGGQLTLSADGTVAYVGAIGDDGPQDTVDRCGALFRFDRSGTAWAATSSLGAPLCTTGEAFGSSVALSADNRVLVVASPLANNVAGRILVFR